MQKTKPRSTNKIRNYKCNHPLQNKSTDRIHAWQHAMISYWLQHTEITTPSQNKQVQIHVSTTHRCRRVIAWVVAEVSSPYSGFSWYSQNCHRYSLSIDCIAPKGRREPSCQGGSQTRGAAGRSASPSVRRRTEVRRPSFPRCWPTWISRPRHLRGLPPWPTTSAQASLRNRTAGKSYRFEVGWRPCRGVDDWTRS